MEEIVYLIPLTRGRHVIVDEDDWEELRKHKWFAQWNRYTKSFYARRWSFEGGRHAVEMHRAIVCLAKGDGREVDHLDHNTLDNRRNNLRVVTRRENCGNRRDQSPYGSGITLKHDCPRARPFRAAALVRGKYTHIGHYSTAEEAREARKRFLSERGLS